MNTHEHTIKFNVVDVALATDATFDRFHGLLWPNLVAEDADELTWVHKMKLRL